MRALVIGLVLFASGCGETAVDRARETVALVAKIAAAEDVPLARGYTDAARVALDSSATLVDYRARMEPWDFVHDAYVTLVSSLRGAESALDAAVADGFNGALGCVAHALRRFIDAARAVGLELPQGDVDLIHGLSSYTTCPEPSE